MRTFLFAACFLLSIMTIAQKNTAFLEIGGIGGFTSINYERALTGKANLSLRIGLGATFFEFEQDESSSDYPSDCVLCGIDLGVPDVWLTIPTSIQYLHDLKNNNYMEVGIGSAWQLSEKSIFVFHGNLGFRRNFGKDHNWMWKVNVTPIIGVLGENAVKDSEPTVWGGIAIGKRF